MTTAHHMDVQDTLSLPDDARKTLRLTKKEIVGQYDDSSPADARLLRRVVGRATIAGVLGPDSLGAQTYRDDTRRVDFIPVLDITLVEGTRHAELTRVAELLHRSMPRPAVIAFQAPDREPLLSLALTRLSRSDSGQETSVIESSLLVPIDDVVPGALDVGRLIRTDLWALYRDLVRVAASGGRPARTLLTADEAITLRRQLTDLDTELAGAVSDAKREKNQQRRIDLNAHTRALRTEINEVRASLFGPDTDQAKAEQ